MANELKIIEEPIIKIKLTDPNAKIPTYAKSGDVGADLYATSDHIIYPGDSALVKTGIYISLPPNHEAQIRPRSGLAYHKQVTVLNTPGTIDAGYRGEIGVILINHGGYRFKVHVGDRIAQMVIKPVLQAQFIQVDELESTDRGDGGFGHTGATWRKLND